MKSTSVPDRLEPYREIARGNYKGGATPFRVGQALGEHAPAHSTYEIPYEEGTRGHDEFVKGFLFGSEIRAKRINQANKQET